MKAKSVNILTSIDELKDTRLAVIGELSHEALQFILNNPEPYMSRTKDDWETLTDHLVSQDDFIKQYAKRNFRHLCASPPTNFFFDLKRIIYQSVSDVLDDKVIEKSVNLIINLFPYKCNRSEIVTLRNVLQMEYGFTNEYFNIRFIYKDLSEINEVYIKQNIDTFYIYNINDWLAANKIEEINKLQLSDKVFVSSMLLREGFWSLDLSEKTVIEIPELQKTVQLPPDKAIKLFTEEYINLNIIQASYFSIVNAQTIDELIK